MPIELEINQLPESLDVSASSIIHTKNSTGEDVQVTFQQLLDLVPAVDINALLVNTETSVATNSDFFLFSDASDEGEVKKILVSDFITAIGTPTASGSITGGFYNIGALQFRWGTEDSLNDSPETFTFAASFTNECFGVWCNTQQTDPTNPLAASAYDTTGFTVNRNSNIGGAVSFNYFAIGR